MLRLKAGRFAVMLVVTAMLLVGCTKTVQATAVHRGSAEVGGEVVIIQTGGTIDGVTYEVLDEPPLQISAEYLLFAKESFNGAFYILGGSAGMYEADGAGDYRAVNPEAAPFSELSAVEVDFLLK